MGSALRWLRAAIGRLGLTKRALALFVAGLVVLTVGRSLGLTELFLVGLACWAAIGLGAALVALAPARLAGDRRMVPPRVHAGAPCRIDLHLRNVGTRRSPVVTVRDPFDRGRRHARFRVAPLAPRAGSTAGYRVPTERRGVFEVGPLLIERSDPLGVARRRREVAGIDEITVYPRVAHVAPPVKTRGRDPRGGTVARPALGPSSDEFYALRPYVVGDDLRRVHWASSARLDELMIRQDELPWDGRATIVVDASAGAHSAASFETAMSIAGSLVLASDRAGIEVRLLLAGCAGGPLALGGTTTLDTGRGTGHAHVDRCFELLAAAQPGDDPSGGLGGAMAGLARSGLRDDSLCVVATPRSSGAHLAAAGRLSGRGAAVTVLLLDEAGRGSEAAAPLVGGSVLRIPDFASFGRIWDRAMVATNRAAGAPTGAAR